MVRPRMECHLRPHSRNVKAEEVMLCRFDRVEGKGLFGLAGFLDLDDKTPDEVATLITQRLALNEGYPKDYYTPTSSRPGLARCRSTTRLAGRRPQRGAARVCTAHHPGRAVPSPSHPRAAARPASPTLPNSFSAMPSKFQDLTCGRFDFKGSSDMDAELRAFAERLEVPSASRPAPASPASSPDLCRPQEGRTPDAPHLRHFRTGG